MVQKQEQNEEDWVSTASVLPKELTHGGKHNIGSPSLGVQNEHSLIKTK